LPPIKTERLQHYFSTYKMIPGKNVEIRVDGVYGREEALAVIAASQKDYQNHYGHLLQKSE
jgi:inorganic pyrophosphatase